MNTDFLHKITNWIDHNRGTVLRTADPGDSRTDPAGRWMQQNPIADGSDEKG